MSLLVLIIGCGNIAGYFDEKKNNTLPYTHAGAYHLDQRFKILACVEPNELRREEFMRYWNVEFGFSTLNEIDSSMLNFDVISICSPTKYHYQDLQIALEFHPKVIFCEKPVTTSLKESQNIVYECEKRNILLAINYTRSWDPSVLQLKQDIISNKWGELRSISGTYNKGILNNGSHMLDLIYNIVNDIKLISVGKAVFDFFEDDPTVPMFLESSSGVPIQLVTAHAQDYALFELQLIFSKGVLTMEEGGFTWRERKVEPSQTFSGYNFLNKGTLNKGMYEQSMSLAVENLYNAIFYDEPLFKTGTDALKVQSLCEQIKKMALTNG